MVVKVDDFMRNFVDFVEQLIDNLIRKHEKSQKPPNIYLMEFILKVVISKASIPLDFKLIKIS